MSDLRAALETAVSTHEEQEKGGGNSQSAAPAPAGGSPGDQQGVQQPTGAAPDQSGTAKEPAAATSTPATGLEKPGEKPAAAPKPGSDKNADQKQVPEGGQEKKQSPVKAPVSWRPQIREKWTELPAEVQHEVLRREREISETLRQSADARKFVEGFQSLVSPYQHFFAAEGSTPMEGFNHYLQTAALLRVGAPGQKAEALADLIVNFGIDVAMLDSALGRRLGGQTGQGQSQQMQAQDPRFQQLQQAVAPVIDFVNGLKQRQQQVVQQTDAQLSDALEEFAQDPANEFFADVREDMADILEMAANRGASMSLQDAYSRAIMLHPQISKVVEQRKLAQLAQTGSQSAARARNAAVSVPSSGAPSHGSRPGGDGSIRSAITAAIENLGNG